MRLTKYQKARLHEFEWDIISTDKGDNTSWVSIAPEDGTIYGEIIELFKLTGDGKDVKLLVIGTKEEY
tara:strand:+ start:743 stop:946 length:204 start_codon:yes stop_codon:yes gene_type:complete